MIYDDKMYRYNALDAICTGEIRNQIWDDLRADGYERTYELTMKMYEPLMFMMTRGIRVDKDALEETRQDIQRAQAEAQEELNRLAGRAVNALSPKDCISYFYAEKGIDPYLNKEGKITTDDKAMQRIARGTARRPGLREAALVQTIRGHNKLYSSYLDITFDDDGRMRCSYKPRGTKFGRLSSSKTVFGTGMNAQNLPAEFKKFLVADEGYFFVECDKRQAEWVVVAYLSQDANMLDVIENERDPHTSTAAMMFDVDPEIILHDSKLIGNLTDPEQIRSLRTGSKDRHLIEVIDRLPRTMSGRQAGKKSNHGLNYDEGYRTFALMNEIPEHEAKRLIELYHKVYPGVRNGFHEYVQACLRRDRTLINCFGRKIELRDAWGHELFKSAYSALPQSTVVDGLNQGLHDIYYNDWLTVQQNIDTLAQVHDSILFQFPIAVLTSKNMHKAIGMMYKLMSAEMEYHGRKFRIHTDMKVGWNWGGYHPERNPRGMKEIAYGKSPVEFHNAISAHLGLTKGDARGKKAA